MQQKCHLFLFTSLVLLAPPLSLAFTIDLTNPDLFTGEQKDFFGYKVLQFISDTDKGIIVTAPLQLNGSGGVCRRDQNHSTYCFNTEDITLKDKTIPVKYLGLSIAADSANSQFTVCSPNVAHECNENSYLHSVCYKINNKLQQISNFTPAFQECTKKTVDLVFLFDGSNSMKTDEFNKNKVFIMDIMKTLKNTSIKFAAVQFSSDFRTVFDFKDYQAGRAVGQLQKEPHMQMLTSTYGALRFVLKEILENPKAGASLDATKVLVLITDGDPSDSFIAGDIVQRYDEKQIIRFVIAVKDAKLDKFTDIASQPTDKYAFKIEDYQGLTGILENFQKRIFKMEGSSVSRGGDIKNEMSQSGSSAAFYNDTLVLGSVGSKSWRGSLQELHGQKERQIEDPHMQNDSYLGYSISVGQMDNTPLYFTGAPRFEHTGQVVLFQRDGKEWTVTQRLNGDQIGSYFGAELCSVDVNSDGATDFLLVGAPMFYQPEEKREGQVYVYSLTDEIQLKSELNISVPSVGRFGTTITSLADLNGDGLRDVAVGAPLEDDNRGAVYIYLGDRRRGVRSTFSQRISAQDIQPRLRLFGQAIDGDIDLGEDGLPDIVIGSQGTAVSLSSRPVVNVMAHLSFQPKEISTEKFDCVAKTDENLPMGNLTVCFEMVETTQSKAGVMSSGMNISYMLNVDPMRQMYRGFFGADSNARNVTSMYNLRDKKVCSSYHIFMPKCVTDTLTPISIKLNFSQVDSRSLSAVLNMDSRSQAVIEIPFEKQCAKDICIAELEVDFNFTTPTLVVEEDSYFNVTVKLSNHGDDSYNTSLIMHYPPGLSFSKMTLTEETRPTLHSCSDLEEVLDKTICGISLPVYRSKSAATFQISFYIMTMTDYEWNDTLSMTITGRSDNTNITGNSSLTRLIPVQFGIKMAVTVKEETTKYLNFTSDDDAPKKVEVIYKIANPGWKDFPINVYLFFPLKLEHDFEMMDYNVSVQQNKSQCSVADIKSENCSPYNECRAIVCDTFMLDKESDTDVMLTGNVQFRDLKKHAENIAFLKRYTGDSAEVKFKSFIHVTYDRKRYVLDSHQQKNEHGLMSSHESGSWKDNDPTRKWAEIRVEFIIPPHQLTIISTGVGLGVLLFIIITVVMFKLGCFKRKKYYEDQEEAAALQDDGPLQPTSPAPTNGTVVQPEAEDKPEEKRLLGDGEANGGISTSDTQEALEETKGTSDSL